MHHPEMTPEAGAFMEALANTGYMLPIITVIEIVAGILLLVNRFTALSLVLVFPVLLNAFLLHLILDLPGIGASFVFISLNISLFFLYKERYLGVIQAKEQQAI